MCDTAGADGGADAVNTARRRVLVEFHWPLDLFHGGVAFSLASQPPPFTLFGDAGSRVLADSAISRSTLLSVI